MIERRTILSGAIATAAAGLVAIAAPAAAKSAWVPVWMASPERVWGKDIPLPTDLPRLSGPTTLRQPIHLARPATSIRIRLSNAYGHAPLEVDGAHLAVRGDGAAILAGSDRALTFAGKDRISIPAGGTVLSDPVASADHPARDWSVSLFFAKPPAIAAFHWDGKQTSYLLSGDQLSSARPAPGPSMHARLVLSEALAALPPRTKLVVAIGDSITDGRGASDDGNRRWPDELARRLGPADWSVVNAGISGARLLSDGMGDKALARLDRDVLSQPHIAAVIVLLGTNDIAWPGSPFAPNAKPMTLEQLAGGYRNIVRRAHARHVRVIAGTIPPFAGALPGTPFATSYYTPAKDRLRIRFNQWVRTTRLVDGVADFDRALADPNNPSELRHEFDSGDHLHPNDRGDAAMAEAVKLAQL